MSMMGDNVAVIGLAGRFPGAAGVAELWDNLCAGRDCIRSLSDDELRGAGVTESDLNSSSYVKAGALLEDVDKFDAAFFKIAPLEAELMDPQIRLLLQCAWETLEDAGYASRDAQNIGVFAGAGGVTTSYFANFVNRDAQFEKITASPTHLANDKDFLATYLSYKLNLIGPSVTVQTACSTSLVALHQARLSLLSGECDMALAGGVTIRVPHGHGYHYKEGYIFSKSGRIRTFDAAADGVVFGSGLGLVLIKRLQDAIRDGDNIHAIIRGSAIANDGRGKMSYAASSAKGQMACIRSALNNAGVHAGSIGFVETHGTGTAMGDPEEVKALTAVFKGQTDRKNYCGLGAVKTNIGHLEAAAGIVGFIKAALAVKHGVIPPTAHYSKANPRIKFDSSPFYVNNSLQPWDEGSRPRRAAVNSLGVGGTNAFVIVEEFVPAQKQSTLSFSEPSIVPLSAKSPSSLQAYVKKLADYLAGEGGKHSIDLLDLAYTLQVGREAMECRVAFTVSSLDQLQQRLKAYLETGTAPVLEAERASLAAAWIDHADVDWQKLYPGEKPRRISLPTYVFAKERYWIESAATPASAARAVMHPLLHVNTSDLSEHRYSSTFNGDEFFLRDHVVRMKAGDDDDVESRPVLPGVAYLEMARAALERALPSATTEVIELRDVVWVQPIVVAGERQVNIALAPGEGRVGFEVFSDDQTIHCQGQARHIESYAAGRLDLAKLKESTRQWDAAHIYPALAGMGLAYGPAHQALTHIYMSDGQVLARLQLPAAIMSGLGEFGLHPSLLDGTLQATILLQFGLVAMPDHPVVPFALESLRVHGACTSEMYAWIRYSSASSRGQLGAIDVDLCDQDGNIRVEIRGFVSRALGKESASSLIATEVWQAAPAAKSDAQGDRHILLYDLPHIDATQLEVAECAHVSSFEGGLADQYSHVALACFEKLRALIESKPERPVHVQLVLPNSQVHAVFTGLSGLFKTATQENPRVTGQIVLVPDYVGIHQLRIKLLAEHAATHDSVVKYDVETRTVRAWQLLPSISNDPNRGLFEHGGVFKDRGVYLISGGLGGLGVLFAREILDRSAQAKIVLTGRASFAEVQQSTARKALLDSLQANGAAVEYRQLDLCDLDQVASTIESIRRQHGQLNGILHSAGMMADSFILKKTSDEVRAVLAPKVLGTANLDAATKDVDLDFLVLFSSLSSAVGNLGQADYAAANGFLDQFAELRNRQVANGQRRGHTLTIRWPLWRHGGMQVDQAGRDMLRESTGIRPLQTRTGLLAFYRSLASGLAQTLVMEGDAQKTQQTLHARPAAAEVAKSGAIAVEVRGDLASPTQEYLQKQLSALLKLPAHKIDPRAPLEDYGINSILALDFTRALEQTFGTLSKTLFFEYLTIRDLAGYFVKSHAARLSELFSVPAAPAPQPATIARTSGIASIRATRAVRVTPMAGPEVAPAAEPIAIVGLSGRYPESRDIEALWRNLRDGKDCIIEVPKDRWDWREYYSEDRSTKGRHFSKWGGFVEGVDEFDARFFNISPVEAETIDPQERLFLQHAWMAIEDAGYTRASLQLADANDVPGQVGVYAGVMYGEYQLFGAEASLQGNRTGFASNLASIANRVSYVLNLHGPSMAVDTMCSSSLTAIHLACQDLKLGRTAVAIAGGVNVTIHPNKYLMLSAGQFISGDGHCQSFGEGGDGYIPGEGVGVVVLKRLSDAQRDGNHIYGVIRGSALSHGGKTNGYTVPNPQAQASAIRQALLESRVDARHISYIEAHGTGTKLGDPIEIAALSKVFQEHTSDTEYCLIGSAKSNIGHCEAAAGIAGLTKVLLQLKHQRIVPSLHSARLNPHIDFRSSPFVVNQTLRTWEQPVVDGRRMPRIAGISSFGAGGSNAHLIVEEYAAPAAARVDGVEMIVPLSARTAEQLQQKARDLLEFVRAQASVNLSSLAYTLQIGREPMDERAGFLVRSVEQLRDKLQSYVDGRPHAEGVYEGQVKPNKDTLALLTQDPDLYATIDKWIAEGKQAKLLELWVRGLEFDWRKLHAVPPSLTSLPTYPFARQRFWVDVGRRRTQQGVANVLHPLLHTNTSDFSQQSYTSTFNGDESFLVGAPGNKALSEAACLELARVAVEKSLPSQSESSILELRNIRWAQPAAAIEGKPITCALFDNTSDRVRFELYCRDEAREAVLCQGEAVFHRQPAPARLDLAAIRQDGQSRLIELALTAEAEESSDYILHPKLMADALRAASALADESMRPIAVASVRIVFAATKSLLAWVRFGRDARAVDIDLADEHGNVCVQLRGVQYQQAAVASVTEQVAEPTRISIDAPRLVALAAMPLQKPSGIALATPAATLDLNPAAVEVRARIPLVTADQLDEMQVSALGRGEEAMLDLLDHGNGLFEIRLAQSMLSTALLARLLQAMKTVERTAAAKVLMISGADDRYFIGGRDEHERAIELQLYRTVADFPYPVIAAVAGDAAGAGFLTAALCDFMICSEQGRYSFTDPADGLYPTSVHALFEARLGVALATDFLYANPVSTGWELKQKGWTCPIVPPDQVRSEAMALAANLAKKSKQALRLLKQHLARHLLTAVKAIRVDSRSDASAAAPAAIDLDDKLRCIDLQAHSTSAVIARIRALNADFSIETLCEDLQALGSQLTAAGVGVVLISDHPQFLPVERISWDVAKALRTSIRALPCPVITAFNANASSAAWLLGQCSDACVYSEAGSYSSTGFAEDPALAGEAYRTFSARLGNEMARRIVLSPIDYSGAQLRGQLPVMCVEKQDRVVPRALQIAESLAALPAEVLGAWRRQAAATFEKVTPVSIDAADNEPSTPAELALESKVITATLDPQGILVVRMADRDAKNMFSDAFSRGMQEVFAHVERNPACKVVLITGYDSYFSSGGTQDMLLAIHEGRARFTDNKVFQLPLTCKVPVIAAMQGHGIGAGWALGMFADFALFGEESRYFSPYMGYGFTPGAGSTLIFPTRIGYDLARESLLTAREYSGAELKQRGMQQPVLPRQSVVAEALTLAQQIARRPRTHLIALKSLWTQPLHQPLQETYELELAMHALTFVGQADTLAQIVSSFGADTPVTVATAAAAKPVVVTRPMSTVDVRAVTTTLRRLLADELRMQEQDIGDDEQFVDLGLDSITGVTWIRKINEKYGTSIEAIKVYSFPTLTQLSGYVAEQARQSGPAEVETKVVTPPVTITNVPATATLPAVASLRSWRKRRKSKAAGTFGSSQSIAVVGMAGQFPRARNLEEFWDNIAQGRDCVGEVPKDRWDIDRYYQAGEAAPGKTNSKWLGALDEYDLFDAAFFNISPREAKSMDPQQRLFLQACWHTIEHAGYNPKSLSGSRCGVFVGCSTGDYHQLSKREQLSGQGFTGAATSILAARISYFLDLHGPSLSIDTACSSSLVAIAHACDSLISGGSDIALAGGVNVMAGPAMHIMTAQVGMLSPTGRCYAFDRRADGIATGEGVGVVMLKRLADAERDQDWIHGVIEGWGVNQDGRTNGITAPNADSQARLQQEVYERFQIDPAGIQLIEAHGTGTPLGDPIEVAGLKAAFARFTDQTNYCALGSVKSNIGHCLTAAGVSGFMKLLLALRHRQLPPTLHVQQINPHISLAGSPFYVNTRLQEWRRQEAALRRAAINSFGFSGTNAHVVIAEYPMPREAATREQPVIVPLSAKTTDQLQRQASQLLSFIRSFSKGSVSLSDLAYTLQVGREDMNERLALIVGSIAELEQRLAEYLERAESSATSPDGVYRGQVSNQETLLSFSADEDFQRMIGKWISHQALPKLAELWVKGLTLDWSKFHSAESPPQRIALPTYPFAKERHWIEASVEPQLPLVSGNSRSAAIAVPREIASPVVAVPTTRPEPARPTISLDQLRQQLRASLAEALFMKPADIEVGRSFTELGMDSIIGVEWVKTLNKQYNASIAATKVYDFPTIEELAAFLYKEVVATSPAPRAVTTQPAPIAKPAAMTREILQQQLKASLADALFMKPTDIEVGKSFTELGMDSIIGVEWVKALSKQHGIEIAATRVYDYPTIKELAAYLLGQLPAASAAAERLPNLADSGEAPASRQMSGAADAALYFAAVDRGQLANGDIFVDYAITPETNVCLREHVVFDEHLFPTDAFIELILAAYRTHVSGEAVALRNISIANPLLGEKGVTSHVRVVFRQADSDVQFFVRSSVSPAFEDEKLHMQGFITEDVFSAGDALDPQVASEQQLSAAEIPTNTGSHYAPLQRIELGRAGAVGFIEIPAHDFKFVVNPFALYGGLCTAINYAAYVSGEKYGLSEDQFLPHRMGSIAIPGGLVEAKYRCHVHLKNSDHDSVEVDFDLVDETGRRVVAVTALSLRRVSAKAIQQNVAATSRARPVSAGEQVAIIGMSCRYPMSESIEAFWNNLRQGRDCLSEVPADRWRDHPQWYHPDPRHPNTSYSKWGGFLDRIDTFDPLFFGISPAEAELIDPQQRIFLEECWKSIESAGYAPSKLAHQSCGVYVGCSTGDYSRVLANGGQDTAGAAFMGTSNAILAARISYYLNLKGPALAVDTACSSSLVAVHLACESIRSGENQWAIAGGINLLATPIGHILTSQVGMPSPDGRCSAFDAAANGIVFSEGCGVLVLKALSQALRDNDNILGVIQASGINQDGKTNGITAPSSTAQEQLLRQTYAKFRIDAKRISYVEAHGTATPLGDPIEVNALTSVFQKFTSDKQQCALGSVKSNIGHTGFAAGVAGIIKVLLSMKHRKLVPSIHYSQPNPHIDFGNSPFFVNTEYRDWHSDEPRLATVSSFGFSGTNAHVVIEEYPQPAKAAVTETANVIVPLSARAEEQLQQRARDLLSFIRTQQDPLDLTRLAYTLQVGRDSFEHRLGFIASSTDQLADKLQRFIDGKSSADGVYRGQVARGDDTLTLFTTDESMRAVIDQWLVQRNLPKLLELWVRGFELDWTRLHAESKPRPLSLPTYPFAKERYWVTGSTSKQGATPTGGPQLHPLLHANTSDLSQQGYSSTFSGDEFFLTDHRVNGERILPAVAYLEMARAAVRKSMPEEQASMDLELKNVAWAQPIIVTEPKRVTVAVFAESAKQINFEIYSQDGDSDEVMHCQGQCVLGSLQPPGKLDLNSVRTRMTRGTVSKDALYARFAAIGLQYGTTFQGITAVHRGEGELLVELSLPELAQRGADTFILHPSLMDSALQGSISLIEDIAAISGKPPLPFTLESLCIYAPCTEQMMALVKYSEAGQRTSASLIKVDIDLCDREGNVCVRMRGFSSRSMQGAASFDEAHYQSIIAGVLNRQLSADEAEALG